MICDNHQYRRIITVTDLEKLVKYIKKLPDETITKLLDTVSLAPAR